LNRTSQLIVRRETFGLILTKSPLVLRDRIPA